MGWNGAGFVRRDSGSRRALVAGAALDRRRANQREKLRYPGGRAREQGGANTLSPDFPERRLGGFGETAGTEGVAGIVAGGTGKGGARIFRRHGQTFPGTRPNQSLLRSQQ